MSNPTLRRAIDRLVDMAWEEAGKPQPQWDGFAVRAIATLPANYQREIFASEDTDFERLFVMVAAKKIRADCKGLPN